MTDRDRALDAILGLEGDEPGTTGRADAKPPPTALPSLDERVDIFLRAIHGPGRVFTAAERTAARDRILEAMAANLEADPAVNPTVEQRERSAGSQARSAHHDARAPQTSSTGISVRAGVSRLSELREAVSSLVGQVVRDVLFPFSAGLNIARSRAVAVAATLVIALGASWAGLWLYQARTLEARLAAWTAREADAGRSYGCANKALGGSPIRIEIMCIEPRVVTKVGQATYVLGAKRLVAAARIGRPNDLQAELVGPLALAEPGRPAGFRAEWASAKIEVADLSEGGAFLVIGGLKLDRLTASGAETVAKADQVQAELEGVDQRTTEVNVQIRERGAVALAQGQIGLDSRNQIDGTLQITSTVDAWRQFAQSFGDRDQRRVELAQAVTDLHREQLAAQAQSQPGNLDAAPAPSDPVFEGRSTIDMPLRFSDGAVFIGSTMLGEFPPRP